VIATDAQGERLGTLRTFPNLPEGERREIPVTARPRTGRAEVQVLREGDRPAGRRVFLCLYPPDWVHRWLLDGKVARDALGRSNLPGEFVFQARTDGHGIARYEGLPPGEYLVEVPGVGDRSWALEVGDAPARLDLRLDEALPEEHVVRGVVRGRAGPLANLAVHLVAGKSVLGWAMTGPDGKFSVRTREWPPDRLVVWVPQGGGGPVRRDEFTLPNDLSQEIDLRVD